jgi:hypothetical protein
VLRQADAAAARLHKDASDDAARIRLAYLRFLGRPATAEEVRTAQDFLSSYAKALEEGVGPFRRRGATWAAFCQALFASAEFQYRN